MLRRLFCLLVAIAAAAPAAAAGLRANFPTPDPSAPLQQALPATPCVNGFAGIYPCSKINLQAFMPLSSLECGSGAVVWGWTDPSTQKEYALMACNNGTSFVDISFPASPVYLGRLPGHAANSSWRDVKVAGNYAYVGSEATNHGIQVFDLTRLRNVTSPPVTFTEDAHYPNVGRSHTLAINESTGYLFAAGSMTTCGGDLHMINIQNPLTPTGAGCLALNGYVHEAQCVTYTGPDTAHQGREICINSNGRFDNSDTLSIVDVTNKSSAIQLARVSYPGAGYTHQAWLTEDQKYLLLDDEFDEQDNGHNTRTYIWNVTDLETPVLIGSYLGTTTAVDHNQYTRGNYVFQSNYRAGLRILDLTNIATGNLTEFGYFDIYPANDLPNFNGAWGNYPYFPSGNVVVSGIEQGLFILQPLFLPKLLVNDISVVEGDGSTRFATFTVTLSAASSDQVTVDYATANGTASTPSDYFAASGQIIFPPGTTTRTKSIGVVGDATDEQDETFFLDLFNSDNAEIGDARGVGTIVNDDDPVPTITISDISINEGDSGTSPVTVTLSLTPASSGTVTVDYATANGTADSPGDYVGGSDTVEFEPGDQQKTITFTVNGDLAIEPNETFFVNLSNATAALGDSQAIVTIINDDALSVTSIAPTSGPSEGGTAVTIYGTRFAPEAAVHFGAEEAAEVVWVSQGEITATTPPLAPGTLVSVDVHNEPHSHVPTPEYHPPTITFFSDFLDVADAHPFHDFVEKIFRAGITSGCGGGNYCPEASVTRQQMAVFLLASKYGSSFQPPDPTGIFDDVPTDSGFARWVERLYNEGVTAGCSTSPPLYCPHSPVTRGAMAVFLLATKEGSSYQPPDATGMFADVPIDHPFARWIEELARRGITAGCGGGNYCPNAAVTRGQMAVFLVATFGVE